MLLIGLKLFLFGTVAISGIQALIALAILVENRRFARRRRDPTPPEIAEYPKVALIVTCGGEEVNLRDNFHALICQDYPNFELLFVVEKDSDPAVRVIRNLINENRLARINLVISGLAENCGQNPHQIRTAIRKIPNNTHIVAVTDASLKFKTTWLRWLIGRLVETKAGAVTGAIWAIPRHQSLPNKIYCALLNSFAATFGPGRQFCVWGGWGARLDVLQAAAMESVWATSLSEKWTTAKALQLIRKKVQFEPHCVGIQSVSLNWQSLLASLIRENIKARAYAPTAWRLWFLGTLLVQIGFWTAIVQAAIELPTLSWAGFVWTGIACGLLATGVLRGLVQNQLGKVYAPNWKQYRATRNFICLAWPLTSLFSLCLSAVSGWMQVVTHRDLVYRVASNGSVRIIGRQTESELQTVDGDDNHATIPFHQIPPHGEVAPIPGSTLRSEVGDIHRAA
jgi:hypothetical protein